MKIKIILTIIGVLTLTNLANADSNISLKKYLDGKDLEI